MGAGPRGLHLLAWIVVFTVVCTVFIGLRFWAAAVSKRRLYPDDFMIVFAFINTITLEAVTIWAIFNGLGKHTNDLSFVEFGVQFKLIVSSGVTWLLGTVFIKISVLWLYTRIFSTKTFLRWAYTFMAVVGCYGVAFLILFMSRCRPVSQQWAPVPGGSCRDITIDEITSVTLNMVIDIFIVVLPMPVLWSLQLAVRSKLAVSVMFSIGLITIAIMTWRLQFTIVTLTDPDFVYNLYNIGLISFLELWLGIIAACIPTLGPLLKTYVKPAVSKLSHRSERSNINLQNVTAGSKIPSRGSPHIKKKYSQIDDDSSNGSFYHTNTTEAGSVTTNCTYEPGSKPPKNTRGVIYVQHDIEAQR